MASIVLGVNKGRTLRGKELRLGGVALAMDAEIKFAVAEERVTGNKWAGGYDKSLRLALQQQGVLKKHRLVHMADIDTVAVSTCCEGEEAALHGHQLEDVPKLVAVNHHISHASVAYFPSGFDSALVCVIDGGGNTYEENSPQRWWECNREQHSYYVGSGHTLELVDRDFFEPGATGFGEIYRAFTYWLGWPSSTHAAKLMALAAYGNAANVRGDSFAVVENGRLRIPVRNDPNNPIGMIEEVGKASGVDFGEPRTPNGEILPVHKDVAAYVQRSLEEALLAKLEWLAAKHSMRNLCMAGGFALNCVINGGLSRQRCFDNIYIPSTPGDEGQAIGNALWYSFQLRGPRSSHASVWRSSKDVQLGPMYKIDSATTVDLLTTCHLKRAVVFEADGMERAIAELINAGSVVCVYKGRSEAGPRALGQRSMLGDPRGTATRELFNQLKNREWIQPFAPAILGDCTEEYFGVRMDSPFMSFALPIKGDMKDKIPAVVHGDGTARIQTVSAAEDSFLSRVLGHFRTLAGIPLLLNTSFNAQGEPIVETPRDAVRTFERMKVNALVVERFLILKNLFPSIPVILMPALGDLKLTVVDGGNSETRTFDGKSREMIRWIQDKTAQVVFVRGDFPLYGEFHEWLVRGKKVTTIRFRKGGVEIPRSTKLPLFTTKDFFLTRGSDKPIKVVVTAIKYQRFGELNEEDATRDGFSSLKELNDALKAIYPKMGEADWVTVYSINPDG